MKRGQFASLGLAALGCVSSLAFAQDSELGPDGQPIPRAVPVAKPAATPLPAASPAPKSAPSAPKPTAVPQIEMDDPGTIRVSPSATAKSPDQVQMEIADGFYSKKMYDLAAPEYERYLGLYQIAPDRQAALFRLGESYRHIGATNASRNAYETLLTDFQEGDFVGPAAFRLGDLFYRDKQFRDALTLYRKAGARMKDPSHVNAAKFFSARCMEALGQKYDARQTYEELVSSPQNNSFYNASRLSLALMLKEVGRTADAVRQIQMLIKQAENPDLKLEATVRYGLWSLEMQPPQTKQAEEAFATALAMPQQNRWKEIARVGQLRIHFIAGRYQQVVDGYNADPAQFSADTKPEVLLLVANAARQLGKSGDALGFYDQLIRDSGSSGAAKDAQYERLKTLYATDSPDLVAEIDKFLADTPDAANRDELLLMKAESLFKKQDYAGAMPIYSTLELSRQLSGSRKADALFRLGWCQMQLHNSEQALKAFTSFIENYPTHKLMPLALIQHGLGLQAQKNLAGALKDYDMILRSFPKAKEREMAAQQKALILGQQGDNTAMSDAFKLLLKDFPNTAARPQAEYWIGWAAFEGKNYKDAVTYLTSARKLDPEQFGEKASIRILLSYYYLEDKEATAREADYYAKEGKTKVPADILRWLGAEFYKAGAHDVAEKYLVLLTTRDEVTPDDFLLLGRSELAQSKYKESVEALQTYLKSTKLPAARARGLLTLAAAQIGLQTLDDAQKSVDEALALQPEGEVSGEGRIAAGDIQMARKNFEEAAKVYKSVSVILDHPEITPRALEKAVLAYQTSGFEDEAKKTLNTLKSRYPEYKTGQTKAP